MTWRCARSSCSRSSRPADGTAWVLYSNYEVYEVSIIDASCKKRSSYKSAVGVFGMGFVMDAPNGTSETLYVSPRGSGTLGKLDAKLSRVSTVGALGAYDGANPELTGTRDARLYGFFPAIDGPAFVQEIDKQTADAKGPRWNLGSEPMDI